MLSINTDSALFELSQQKEQMKKAIKDLKRRLSHAPSGKVQIESKGKQFQYYLKDDSMKGRGTYLPRKQLPTAQKLAQKDYDIRLLEVLEEQLKTIEQFLKKYDPNAPLKVYEKLSAPRKSLVTNEFITDEEYVKQWLEQPYRKWGFKAEDPEFYTSKGERVRSKSEVIIADTLARHNIPYLDEFLVYEDGILVAAPDFKCLNVRLRQDYYWEHLGMLDDAAYADNNVRKLNKYTMNKDFDETKLILTTETKKHPLNTRIIEEKIRRYLQ